MLAVLIGDFGRDADERQCATLLVDDICDTRIERQGVADYDRA